jgi:hypothetical protein
MRGKFTGALSLIGLGILLKNPPLQHALNQWVDDAARKVIGWIPGVGRILQGRERGDSAIQQEATARRSSEDGREPSPGTAKAKRDGVPKKKRSGQRKATPADNKTRAKRTPV